MHCNTCGSVVQSLDTYNCDQCVQRTGAEAQASEDAYDEEDWNEDFWWGPSYFPENSA